MTDNHAAAAHPLNRPDASIGPGNTAPYPGNAASAFSTHATGYQARASTSPDPPQASSATAQSTQGGNTPPSGTLGQTPTAPTHTSITDSVIDPQLLAETNSAPVNLRLERAKANSKKRKSEGKATSLASKKQKTKIVGLAEPDEKNTLRSVPHFYPILNNKQHQKYLHETMECAATGWPRSRLCV